MESPPDSLPQIRETTSVDPSTSSNKPNNTNNSKSRPSPINTNVPISLTSTATSFSSSTTRTTTTTVCAAQTLHTPTTPRIDISRASSSSHHDSRESSPENVFDQVGTGTLIESGFKEEGAMDLRSSTEELYFMEPDKEKTEECEKPHPAQCRSPVIFKFDDPQLLLQQHQRKDSASSEVAGFLCISGRSSRISSVGSQGSGVSRLSAISGVSRSPSPHKMLVETSFCGPKPLQDGVEQSTEPNVEALEQIVMARKHDPTQVILAEGVRVDSSTPKRKIVPPMDEKAEKKADVIHKAPEVRITRPSVSPSGGGVIARGVAAGIAAQKLNAKKEQPSKVVVGVMPSGTEYVRINLKPDVLYPDKGVAPGEKVVDVAELQKKPGTLNLTRESRKSAQEQRIQSVSPKPARHQALAKDSGSRSPSPALNISRKSSFCSLFKSNKDTTASPDSPTVRDRSRSRSKGRDSMTNDSISGTPSKQKSVLAIFKPKRSGSKSKCSSPIDPELSSGGDVQEHIHKPKPTYKPPGKEHLKYYESGDEIVIPLHTPPDEKDLPAGKRTTTARIESTPRMTVPPPPPPPMPPKVSPVSSNHSTPVKGGIQVLPLGPPLGPIILKRVDDEKEEKVEKPKEKPKEETRMKIPDGVQVLPLGPPLGPIFLRKTPEKPAEQPKPKPKPLMKLKHVEQPDGSIIIPLKSPSDTEKEEKIVDDKNWSIEVQRHSSQSSQETVISSTHLHSGDENSALPNNFSTNSSRNNSNASQANGALPSSQNHQQQENSNKSLSPVPTPGAPPPTPAVPSQQQQQQSSREKKHILFSMKLGSGSEDGVFATQFSLSKTESLCSQLSEQTSVFNSPTEKDPPSQPSFQRSDTVVKREDSSASSSSVVMRRKDSSNDSKRKSHREIPVVDDPELPPQAEPVERSDSISKKKGEDPNSRLSRYVDPNEIIEAQKKLETLRAKKREAKRLEEEEQENKQKELEQQKQVTVEMEVHQEPKEPEELIAQQQSLDIPKPSSREKSLGSSAEDIVSESEKESEAPSTSAVSTQRISARVARGALEEESAGLVFQESFDDELPYVPTTLPEERGQGVTLIPMKERAQIEVVTHPVERPRSRTPMNPSRMDNYSATSAADSSDSSKSGEKLKISLPKRTDSGKDRSRQRSPRRISNGSGNKTWFDFGEAGGEQSDDKKGSATDEEPPPPPLPPRKPSQQWIDFDNIPEKRKPPKRITTVPTKESSLDKGHVVQYNYVNPEECQCECHHEHGQTPSSETKQQTPGEEAQPLLEERHRSSSACSSDPTVVQRRSHSRSRTRRDDSSAERKTSHRNSSSSNRSSLLSQDSSPNEGP
ncbi:titin [Culicoides brevitarsis]|uniref:titin n=1 Tax=Culicoides brevitarsis TaxID=469753 RepID=UPI00307C3073